MFKKGKLQMATHHSQVDVIIAHKADIDKLYNLLRDLPEGSEHSMPDEKNFLDNPEYAMVSSYDDDGCFSIAGNVIYGNAEKKRKDLKGLYFLSIASISYKATGFKPLKFMRANKINYCRLIEAAFCDEDPSETFWTVRNNETNQQETATTYDEEMMTFLNGRKPLPADDPRLHIQLSDFVKEGIRIFEMCTAK